MRYSHSGRWDHILPHQKTQSGKLECQQEGLTILRYNVPHGGLGALCSLAIGSFSTLRSMTGFPASRSCTKGRGKHFPSTSQIPSFTDSVLECFVAGLHVCSPPPSIWDCADDHLVNAALLPFLCTF